MQGCLKHNTPTYTIEDAVKKSELLHSDFSSFGLAIERQR